MKQREALRICIFFLSLVLNQCYAHFALENKPPLQKNPELFLSKKKIALIGFNAYDYEIALLKLNRQHRNTGVLTKGTGFNGFRYYLVANAYSEKSFMSSFGIGKDLSDYSTSEAISEEINYYMLENYKSIVKENSEKIDEPDLFYDLLFKKKFQKIKNGTIDYYILAINYSPFQRSSVLGWFSIPLSIIPSIITFNFLPVVDHQVSYSKFMIYDKNLSLLDELEIKNEYFVFHSLWKRDSYPCVALDKYAKVGARPQPSCIWEGNLKEGQGFVKEFLKEELSLSGK
ncbi:Lp29 family lipoprotein [Leptospira stimsonii]|uniref:Lipoprotein n=1 Tax=Leptospira stimsonii TaxID=2202203 RepID=A0A396YQ01_9LEPT|nr:hypothetical protein [Leptospira stimsonii]RHX83418.1 hypothetical protein DLM75_23935 [Leptospira stimsonii]